MLFETLYFCLNHRGSARLLILQRKFGPFIRDWGLIWKSPSHGRQNIYYRPICSSYSRKNVPLSSSKHCWSSFRHFCYKSSLDELAYESLVSESLENLTEFFENLGDLETCPAEYDVMYGDGVLTVVLGSDHGTYVINKQTPNKQIWLSSPTSGPKRYDYINNDWIYSHDGVAMKDLLTEEFSEIFGEKIDFTGALEDNT